MPIISSVELVTYRKTYTPESHGVGQFQSQPIHQHPGKAPAELVRESGQSVDSRTTKGIFVEVIADDGTTGRYGPIDATQAVLIRDRIAARIIGEDPVAVEKIHDLMLRLDRHGRSGYFMTALSAIDCAVWDLKGKILDQPVYRLLGGPIRERVPAYASMLGFSVEPDQAAETAKEYQDAGFLAQKWFFPWGPAAGKDGLQGNLALAAALRDAVGPHYPLMFDAFMGWDLPFARSMLRALEPYDPFWMEEAVHPEHVETFERLKADCAVPLATGEHVYGRWQTLELLKSGAIDFLQNDPDWTGGLTEQLHIASLASAYDVPLIAHGHSLLPALHLAAARPAATIPYVEFLIAHQRNKQVLQDTLYLPVNGHLALPDRPGLGLEIDPAIASTRAMY